MLFTLITGASSGIGEEFARQYAKKGHSLILTARSADKLEKLAQELTNSYNISIHVIPHHLSQLHSAEELHAKCQKLGVKINLIINDAGVGLMGRFEEQDLGRTEEMLILNIISLTKLCYLFLPDLKKNHGGIINLASQAAFEPIPYMASYSATKAYVLSFTESLREELKDTKMKVLALCPGPTYTDFFKKANASPNDINFKFRRPHEVVAVAIAGMENDKPIVIPGWENKIWTFMTRFIPRSLLVKLSQNMVNKK